MTKTLQQTVETTETKFDNFSYVKSAILKSYCKQLLAGEDTTKLTVQIKNYYSNQFVFGWLNKVNALKVENIQHETVVDETGKTSTVYTINIKDFVVDTKATSKEGVEYRIFDDKTMGKALRLAIA